MKRGYEIGSGRVIYQITRTKTEDGKLIITEMPVFRGSPEKQARGMMKAHTPAGALAIVDKLLSKDTFWLNVRNYIMNRIKEAGEKKVSNK